MKTLMIRYKTTKEGAATNEAKVHAVFDELRKARPAGLKYGTLRLADGVSFVHIAVMESPEVGDALTSLPAFKEFQKGLAARCVEAPAITELVAVDSYGLLA
jgi:hypothetical protein